MKVISIHRASCDEVRKLLAAFAGDELSVETRLCVMRHLTSCKSCSTSLHREVELKERLRASVKNIPVPPTLTAEVRMAWRTYRQLN